MLFEPWMLAAMEEAGYMDNRDGQLNRVANCLAESHCAEIGEAEFRSTCCACCLDPDSLTHEDLARIQRKLREC